MITAELPPGTYPVVLTCHVCDGEIHTYTDANLSDPMVATLCEPFRRMAMCKACHDAGTTREAKQRQRARAAEWSRICPIDFRDTQLDKLPILAKYEDAMKWRFGPKGLVMHGDTGMGKSRAAWSIGEREFMAGRSFEVMDANFGLEYGRKVQANGLMDWLEMKMKADLLLMDDVFKVKPTDAVEQAIFGVMEERIGYGRPFIVTLNDNGASLQCRLSPDRAEPIIRRIREYCHPISFSRKAVAQ